MARGKKRSIEDKIVEKVGLIEALQVRIKSEKGELELLYREKRERDLEGLTSMLDENGLSPDEAASILQSYVEKNQICTA